MSRSRRQPIIKDTPRNHKKSALYWRTIRRVTKQKVHILKIDPDVSIPIPKEIVNDYNYCDYVIDFRYGKRKKNEKFKEKAKRK